MSSLNLKNKLKKLIVLIIIIILLGTASIEVKTYPYIPLKGLFNVLKEDDIGFAHALLHSKWIENMYQYGAGKPHREVVGRGNRKKWKIEDKGDVVANLVRKFWFRRSENHQLLPTKFGCLANIPNNKLGKVFGQLINSVYKGLDKKNPLRQAYLAGVGTQQDDRESLLIDTLVPYGENFEQYHQELAVLWKKLIDQEYALKHDKKFEQIKLANVRLQEEIARLQLQEKFNMTELNRQITQMSKACKKSKDLIFKNEKKKIESKFDKRGYQKALKEAKQRIFLGLEEELDEYHSIKTIVRKLQVGIDKKVKQKRDQIKKELLLPIAKSLKLCKAANVYMPRTTEGILWALFFHKIDRLRSQEEKVQAIKDCLGCIDQKFKNDINLDRFYSIKEFESFEKKIKKIDVNKQTEEIFVNYDLALHVLITKLIGGFAPEISEGHFGYEYEKGKISKTKHNCYETTMHDFFSLLWYNPKIKGYDDSLFSWDVLQNGQGFQRFRELLKFFYLADEKNIRAKEYTVNRGTSLLSLKDLGKISAQEVRDVSSSDIPVSYVNRSVIKQEFMNIVSGIPEVDYCSCSRGEKRDFELDTNVKNFILVCNYFYGVNSENLEDLGKAISTETREITFEKQGDKDTPNKIKVSLYDKENEVSFKIIIHIRQDHAYISVPVRDKVASKIVKKGVIKRLLGNLDDSKSLALFTLLSSKALLANKKKTWNLPVANFVYYALGMQGNQSKLAIMEDAFKILPQSYNSWKGMVCNLIETFPLDDYSLGEDLRRILVGEYYCSDWSDFIKVVLERGYTEIVWSIINNEEFYKCWNIGKVLQVVMRKEFPDMALRIVKDPQFDASGCGMDDAFKLALEKEYRDIVLNIMYHKKFKASRYCISEALLIALTKGYRDIIPRLAKDPAFDPSCYWMAHILVDALEKSEYEYIALMILQSAKFDCWMEAVKYALKNENTKVAMQIIEHSRCDVNQHDAADALLFALEKGYLDVVLNMMNKPAFDFSKYWVGNVLAVAMEKEYKGIVQKVVESPQFQDWEQAFVVALSFRKRKDVALKILQYPQFYGWQVGVMCAMEDQNNKDIITILLSDPRCDLSGDGLGDLLRMAMEKGNEEVISAAIKVITLDTIKERVAKILELAMEKGYDQVVSAIAKVLTFEAIEKDAAKILKLALKKEYKEIISIIEKDITYDLISKQGSVSDILELALEKDYEDIVLEISENFNVWHITYRYARSLVLALKNAKYEKVAREILIYNEVAESNADSSKRSRDSEYFCLGYAVSYALKKGYKDIAIKLIQNPRFKASSYDCEDMLILAIKGGYVDIFEMLLEHSKCKKNNVCCARALSIAMRNGYEDIALKIIDHPKFNPGKKLTGWSIADYIFEEDKEDKYNGVIAGAFKLALKNGYKKVVLKIVNHSQFNANKSWVKRALVYAKKLLKEKQEDGPSTGFPRKTRDAAGWLQEVIEVIERRQSKEDGNKN